VPIDCFEQQWVIFRGKDGRPGCLQNTCAHRACPLHLGSVNEGRIQCPYHGKNPASLIYEKRCEGNISHFFFVTSGWEYSTDGKCEKMPSTKMLNVRIQSLPCFEQEGMVWIWPGDEPPKSTIPSLLPPTGFTIHAEVNEILVMLHYTMAQASL
jgi:chlorophyllide a oxygenase